MTRARAKRPFLSVLMLLVMAAFLAAYGLSRVGYQRPALTPRQGPALTDAKTWGYQLQNVAPGRIPDGVDVLVIDYSLDGSGKRALTAPDLATLRRRADGRPRIVLAYMSIGEAETYRYYWSPTWQLLRPDWLGEENPEWKGNYPVRFWSRDWQNIILRPEATLLDRVAEQVLPWRKPYLDRILEAGFDGVYLDRVDVYAEFEDARRTAKRDMRQFVETIATYARARRPGFLVVPQNAEELVHDKRYLSSIDGLAKEDLLFGAHDERQPNPAKEVRESVQALDKVIAAGKPVLLVEYVSDADQQVKALLLARQKRYLPLFAARGLEVPPEPVPDLPPADVPAAVDPASAVPADASGAPAPDAAEPAQRR